MKEQKNDSSSVLSRFGRDKRTRTVTADAERVERRPRQMRGATEGTRSSDSKPTRHSFNPHFSEDNRPLFSERERGERSSRGERYGENRGSSFGGRGQKREGGRGFGSRFEREDSNRYKSSEQGRGRGYAPRQERKFEGKPSFGGDADYQTYADYDAKREERGHKFGRKPFGGERKFGDKPYGERQRGERKFGDKPYGERQRGERKFGDKPYGERQRGERSFGDKPFSGRDRKFSDRGESRNGGKFGDRKFGGNDNRSERFSKPSFRKSEDKPSYPSYNPSKQTGAIRLNRFVAQSGLCSRREADDFIQAGVVTVNGEVVSELGTKVMPGDDVRFNGERIQGEQKVYLVLNKPKGYVTSLDDPHASKTVMELVKDACQERIYPVGRLDKNSLGLLLFTNDGDLTKQLTHPSYEKKKIYQVSLDKPLTRADMDRLVEGITLEDGEIHADEVSYVKESKDEVGVEIHSGRNRIVRRMFEFLGYEVQKLDRVYYAGLTKKNMKRGMWRFLTKEEVQRLKAGLYE